MNKGGATQGPRWALARISFFYLSLHIWAQFFFSVWPTSKEKNLTHAILAQPAQGFFEIKKHKTKKPTHEREMKSESETGAAKKALTKKQRAAAEKEEMTTFL